MGTRNNAGECAAVVKLTFPSQVLPCSGSTGVISAFLQESTPDVIAAKILIENLNSL